MDREQARFVLRSFRPDGADSRDPDFEEALAVAADDRELGEWLAVEREQDASVAASLKNLTIPSNLRSSILAALKADAAGNESGSGAPVVDTTENLSDQASSPAGSLVFEGPPEELKEQTLTVLKVEIAGKPMAVAAAGGQPAEEVSMREQGWLKAAVAAVLLVLGAFVAFELTSSSFGPREGQGETIALRVLENEAIAEVVRQGIFPLQSGRLQEHQAWIRENNAPGFDLDELPEGILEGKPVGCRIFMMGAARISHLCFDKDGSRVHLAVLGSENLDPEDLEKLRKSGGTRCRQCSNTGVSVASWQGKDQIYLLLGKLKEKELRELLRPAPGE
jgi:hypothetical protein